MKDESELCDLFILHSSSFGFRPECTVLACAGKEKFLSREKDEATDTNVRARPRKSDVARVTADPHSTDNRVRGFIPHS
jgi:hypothetical protein